MVSAESIFKQMTIEQKLGQMICIRASGYEDQVRSKLEDGIIGAAGAVLFAKCKKDPATLVPVMNEYISRSPVPLLFYLDAESGIHSSLNCGTPFPNMMALGATFSADLAYRMGYAIAKEARTMGFSMVGNPVLDVNSNPRNPIINTRALSDRVEHIIELADAFVQGTQDAGVIPNGKHYPGHGDTEEDSHISMPTVKHAHDYLMEVELKPFRELIRKGMTGIMTAHILYPALTPKEEGEVPATLSRAIITDLLRGQFGFEGLIISDSLTMKSVKDYYGIERAAVMAVQAGNDVLLQDYNSDPAITFRALRDAVKDGKIPEAQIDDSVQRILAMKERFGMLEKKLIDLEEARMILACPEHMETARNIAQQSVTILEAKQLPLPAHSGGKVLLIATVSEDEGKGIQDMDGKVARKSGYLWQQVKKHAPHTELCIVHEEPQEEEISRIETLLKEKEYDQVIYAAFVRVLSYKPGSGTIPQAQFMFIRRIHEQAPSFTFVIFGSPYILQQLDRFDNCICAYSDCDYSIEAAVEVAYGKIKPAGRLPVSVNEHYSYGYGLHLV